MSDLPQAGVQLVAADADQFFGQLDRGNQALQQFGQQATQTASQFGVLDAAEARTRENIADLTDKIGLQQRQLGILQTELKQTTDKYGEGSLQAQRKQLRSTSSRRRSRKTSASWPRKTPRWPATASRCRRVAKKQARSPRSRAARGRR